MYPKVVYYHKGYKYQLASNYSIATNIRGFNVEHDFFQLSDNGILLIKYGYAWDGASGPAIDTKNFMRGSLVHDVGCQMIATGLIPSTTQILWDRLLVEICKEDGMSALRRWWVYKAVRFNFRNGRKPDKPTIEKAP